MRVEVLQCDICKTLIVNEDKAKVVDTLAFCVSCVNNSERHLKEVKSLRAYHILIDITAAELTAKAEEEEEKRKAGGANSTSSTTPSTGTTNTAGFAPATEEKTH